MKWLQIDRRCSQGHILAILLNGGSAAGIWMDNCGKTPRCPVKYPSNPYLTSWFIFALSNWSLIYETVSPSCTVFVLAVQRALIASFRVWVHISGKDTHFAVGSSPHSLLPLVYSALKFNAENSRFRGRKRKLRLSSVNLQKGQAVIFSVLENHKQKGEAVSHTVDTMLISACGPMLMHLSQTGCKMRNHL